MPSSPTLTPVMSVRSPLAHVTSSAMHASDPDLRTVRVLLAEDADLDAGNIREMLESRAGDFRLTRVRALREISDAVAAQTFDLVLLDLELGDAWGTDALRQARALVGDTPIVVLTTLADAKLALACIEAGAEDFVTKGELVPALLDRAIRHAIGRKRAREIDTWLEHSNRLTALGTLAAGIAHEVNNPATVAVMSAGIVNDRLRSLLDGAAPAARETIEEALAVQQDLVESLERIRAAIRNVQSFARPQAEHEELLDVSDMCRRARRIVAGEIKDRARYREKLGASAAVLGDARQLEQVIVNLLINAAHAIPPGHGQQNLIGVETSLVGDRVVIAVSDTGSGIAPELLERIFEPFFTTKTRERGSGLGLWICSRIVSRMGGQIQVSSAVGRGTRFEIVLPRAEGVPSRSITGDLIRARPGG